VHQNDGEAWKTPWKLEKHDETRWKYVDSTRVEDSKLQAKDECFERFGTRIPSNRVIFSPTTPFQFEKDENENLMQRCDFQKVGMQVMIQQNIEKTSQEHFEVSKSAKYTTIRL
jgi:hypothetical protein